MPFCHHGVRATQLQNTPLALVAVLKALLCKDFKKDVTCDWKD